VSSLLWEACEWAASLRLADIPADVRELAIAQALSQAAAAVATRRHPVSTRLLAAIAGSSWAERAARNALLTMALDFDETAFAGHLGHACAGAVLACAADANVSGERALVAQVAASEVAARLTAAVTLGPARGQAAGHTHAVGTAVGASVVLGLSPAQMAGAVGLALAQARRVLMPAFMGSDDKFWMAARPILDAAKCVQLAQRGSIGVPALLEGPGGVLETLADVAVPEAMADYGRRWHLRTLSVKHVPGCAYITALVEAAAALGPLGLDDVAGAEADVSIFTLGMEAESSPFLAGSRTPLPALGFSAGYNLAAALERGGLDVGDLHGSALASPARWRLAGKVVLRHDPALTMAALAATAPVGAAIAWAGGRAFPYLLAHGADEKLAHAVIEAASAGGTGLVTVAKRVGARVKVTLKDGTVLESERAAATGSCQEPAGSRLAGAAAKLRGQLEFGPDPSDQLTELLLNLARLSPAELRRLA
jgi:2-methylcitrate dehydratase PrpD